MVPCSFFVLSEVMFFCPGDIMGRAMKNVDNLLRMPYGCGEQNMALLAPNIYILQYLTSTDQLTPVIEEKSNKFLTSGGCLITLLQYYNNKKNAIITCLISLTWTFLSTQYVDCKRIHFCSRYFTVMFRFFLCPSMPS